MVSVVETRSYTIINDIDGWNLVGLISPSYWMAPQDVATDSRLALLTEVAGFP